MTYKARMRTSDLAYLVYMIESDDDVAEEVDVEITPDGPGTNPEYPGALRIAWNDEQGERHGLCAQARITEAVE